MPELTYGKVNRDILRTLETPGRAYVFALAILIAGVLMLFSSWTYQIYSGLGVSGLFIPTAWAVYITNFVFWVGIAHSGTLISAILYLFRAKWRTPVYRSAEAMTVFAVMTAGLFPLIHLGRPWFFYWLIPYPNQRQIWPDFKSPLIWDVFAVGTYFTVSSMFLYLGLIPDVAAARDRASGWRKKLYTIASLGWRGTGNEWRHFNSAYLFLAAFATPLVVSVHSVVSWDFTMAIVRGWHSTIFAPYFVAGAIHSGLAMVIVLLIPLRRLFRLEEFLETEHFEYLARTMIVTGLILAYSYGIEYFIAWYSGDPFELSTFADRAFGPHAEMFWAMVAFNCAAPLLFFLRRARRSKFCLLAVSLMVLAGMWLERFVIIAVSLMNDFMPSIWRKVYRPTWVEVGISVGALCWFLMLFLIFAKLFPTVSLTEVKESLPAAMRSALPERKGSEA